MKINKTAIKFFICIGILVIILIGSVIEYFVFPYAYIIAWLVNTIAIVMLLPGLFQGWEMWEKEE